MPQTTISRGNLEYTWIIAPTLTPAQVSASSAAEQNFSIAGLHVGDFAIINLNSAQTVGIGIVNARISAKDVLTIQFSNSTTSAATPASGVYLVNISRPESFQNLATTGA